MACGDFGTEWGDYLVEGQFFDAIYCPMSDLVGGTLVALLIFSALMFAIYTFTGDIRMPLVLTVLVGAVAVTQLPGVAVSLVAAAILLGGAAAGVFLIIRFYKAA